MDQGRLGEGDGLGGVAVGADVDGIGPGLFAQPGRDQAVLELDATLDGCERILDDELADRPEQAFYMIGGIDEVRGEAIRA